MGFFHSIKGGEGFKDTPQTHQFWSLLPTPSMYHTWILWVMKLFARSLKQQKDEERHLLFSSGHPTAVGKDIRHLTFTSFQVEFWLVRMDTPPKINIEPENHPF